MKDLIEYIARSLVDDPTQVQVIQKRQGAQVNLKLHVAKEDMGRVMGKGSRIVAMSFCEPRS